MSHDRELLRTLTSKLWILHERHITEFAGGFSEWEDVSAERAHAATVRAAEEASLRKVHERQKVASRQKEELPSAKDRRRKQRTAQRELDEEEAQIASLEARITTLSSALEDPELYTRTDGVEEANRLGAELDRVRRELDEAFARWSAASEMLQGISQR